MTGTHLPLCQQHLFSLFWWSRSSLPLQSTCFWYIRLQPLLRVGTRGLDQADDRTLSYPWSRRCWVGVRYPDLPISYCIGALGTTGSHHTSKRDHGKKSAPKMWNWAKEREKLDLRHSIWTLDQDLPEINNPPGLFQLQESTNSFLLFFSFSPKSIWFAVSVTCNQKNLTWHRDVIKSMLAINTKGQ